MKKNDLYKTDPEYMAIIDQFALDEVINDDDVSLDKRTRYLGIIATLLGCQGIIEFEAVVNRCLDEQALTPVEIKEIIYQATDYLGMGRVIEFLCEVNEIFSQRGIELPLASQATVNKDTRLTEGVNCQVEIFGERMKEAWKQSTISKWLGDNCFGDYYTRTGLTISDRELITFCFLAAQGGCEPQLIAHAGGNINVGNDADLLRKVVAQNLPYIGYPRSLNAMAAIDKATQ